MESTAMWKGRRASELTREELLVAYEGAVRELVRYRRQALQDVEMERLFASARRRNSDGSITVADGKRYWPNGA